MFRHVELDAVLALCNRCVVLGRPLLEFLLVSRADLRGLGERLVEVGGLPLGISVMGTRWTMKHNSLLGLAVEEVAFRVLSAPRLELAVGVELKLVAKLGDHVSGILLIVNSGRRSVAPNDLKLRDGGGLARRLRGRLCGEQPP